MRRTSWPCVLIAIVLLATVKLDSRVRVVGGESGSRIHFIENRGQWNEHIRFMSRIGKVTAAVGQRTLTLRSDAQPGAAVSLTFEDA